MPTGFHSLGVGRAASSSVDAPIHLAGPLYLVSHKLQCRRTAQLGKCRNKFPSQQVRRCISYLTETTDAVADACETPAGSPAPADSTTPARRIGSFESCTRMLRPVHRLFALSTPSCLSSLSRVCQFPIKPCPIITLPSVWPQPILLSRRCLGCTPLCRRFLGYFTQPPLVSGWRLPSSPIQRPHSLRSPSFRHKLPSTSLAKLFHVI